MKVYTLNSFAHQHDLEHRELFGENLRYVIEEFEL